VATPIGDPAGYELAFREGKAAIGEQGATLKETRDRVGTLVFAAAVVAGLATSLGFTDGRADRLRWWGVAGTGIGWVGFAVLTVAAFAIWRPFTGVFTLHSGVLVGSYVEGDPPASLAEMHRELALHLGNHAAYNREQLSDRLSWFTVALWAFLAEIGGLMLMLLDVAT
jgi:hypothetical protein